MYITTCSSVTSDSHFYRWGDLQLHKQERKETQETKSTQTSGKVNIKSGF